mmetsp:Transcript_14275/g.54060  ORF Transcript_14275/g.54060 Transcript_14275/m.54060 type:complete len:293 (+) Transcript_14275:1845-2723(+)
MPSLQAAPGAVCEPRIRRRRVCSLADTGSRGPWESPGRRLATVDPPSIHLADAGEHPRASAGRRVAPDGPCDTAAPGSSPDATELSGAASGVAAARADVQLAWGGGGLDAGRTMSTIAGKSALVPSGGKPRTHAAGSSWPSSRRTRCSREACRKFAGPVGPSTAGMERTSRSVCSCCTALEAVSGATCALRAAACTRRGRKLWDTPSRNAQSDAWKMASGTQRKGAASLVVVAASAIAIHASSVSIASLLDEAIRRICWSISARSHHRRRPLGMAQTASIRKLAVATAVLAP